MGENQSLLKQHWYFGSLGVFMKKRIILSVFASFIFFPVITRFLKKLQ